MNRKKTFIVNISTDSMNDFSDMRNSRTSAFTVLLIKMDCYHSNHTVDQSIREALHSYIALSKTDVIFIEKD